MKISYTKVSIILILFALLIIGGVWIFNRNIKEYKNGDNGENGENGEKKKYEVLVSVRDEMNPDPEEDKRNSMKKGYVIGVYNEGQKWSDTEKISYLILKMELTEEEKLMLIRPVENETEIEVPMDRGTGGKEVQKETIRMREFGIDLDQIGFSDPDVLLKKQPFKDKIFGWEIVKKVE